MATDDQRLLRWGPSCPVSSQRCAPPPLLSLRLWPLRLATSAIPGTVTGADRRRGARITAVRGSETRTPQVRMSEARTAEVRMSEARRPEARTSEERITQSRMYEVRMSERQEYQRPKSPRQEYQRQKSPRQEFRGDKFRLIRGTNSFAPAAKELPRAAPYHSRSPSGRLSTCTLGKSDFIPQNTYKHLFQNSPITYTQVEDLLWV